MGIISAPGKVEFQQRKLPELGSHEVLIKVKAAAICGSDLHIFKGNHPFAALPVAVGHEIAGQVIEIGQEVKKVKKSDKVAVEPVIVDGDCDFCRRGDYHLCENISFQYRQGQGGFTQFFIADEKWVHKLPEFLSYEQGALLEPLSVAVHAVKKAQLGRSDRCAIFGDGAIGLLILLVAKYSGVRDTYIVGIQPHRLELAKELGATTVVNNLTQDSVGIIGGYTSQKGVEVAFEAVGIDTTLVQSLQVLNKGGRSVLVGIFEQPEVKVPANMFIQKEIELIGSQGYNWDFQTALTMVEGGNLPIGKLITHRLPLESLQEGFELLMDPKNKAVKVVIMID
jgi:2-desacetyl-2-hydroxyethyl bacteriochlorophyllide A dehydrogenase